MAHDLRSMLVREEGYALSAYPDPLTHGAPYTIGIGHTGPEVHEGLVWTPMQVDAAYDEDTGRARAGCIARLSPWFGRLDPTGAFVESNARQCVLVGMAFQMGINGLLEFTHTLASVRDGHYDDAAGGILASKWARQTPERAGRMARQMATGQWQ